MISAVGNNFFSTAVTRPIDALPLRIFTYATGPFPYQHDQAWAGSLVLVALVLVLSIGVRALLARRRM